MAPRERLGDWDEGRRQEDALEIILGQSAQRLAELTPIRHGRMAASPWHFYRGAAGPMAADLATAPNTGLNVQLCGDAHVLNFGLWATPERQLAFDLRDFDETAAGPFEWDLKRLVTSLVIAAKGAGRPRVGERAVAACLRSYRTHMADYANSAVLDIWYDLVDVHRLLGVFTEPNAREKVSAYIGRQAQRRTSRGALEKLTETAGGRLRISDNPPFRVHLDADERAHALAAFEAYRMTLRESQRHLLDRFQLVDVVRQVVGVGSVGMRVYLVLLAGRNVGDPLFLQLKEATAAVYEKYTAPDPHSCHGERVVVGKRLIQAATDIFVGWAQAEGVHYYGRQFRDMKIIPEAERLAPFLVDFATACGSVLARAHARTGDPIAIASYIGKGQAFDAAMGKFARAYADQNARDHARLVRAIGSGRVVAVRNPW